MQREHEGGLDFILTWLSAQRTTHPAFLTRPQTTDTVCNNDETLQHLGAISGIQDGRLLHFRHFAVKGSIGLSRLMSRSGNRLPGHHAHSYCSMRCDLGVENRYLLRYVSLKDINIRGWLWRHAPSRRAGPVSSVSQYRGGSANCRSGSERHASSRLSGAGLRSGVGGTYGRSVPSALGEKLDSQRDSPIILGGMYSSSSSDPSSRLTGALAGVYTLNGFLRLDVGLALGVFASCVFDGFFIRAGLRYDGVWAANDLEMGGCWTMRDC